MLHKKTNIYTQAAICHRHGTTDSDGRRFPQYVHVSLSLLPCSQACIEYGLAFVTAPPPKTCTHSQLLCNDREDGVTAMSIPPTQYQSVDSGNTAGALITQLGHCVQSGFGGRPARAVQAFPSGRDSADSLAFRPSQSECIGCQLHLAGLRRVGIGSVPCQSLGLDFSQRASTSMVCPPNLGRGTVREAD